jgi:hypothetical protein
MAGIHNIFNFTGGRFLHMAQIYYCVKILYFPDFL